MTNIHLIEQKPNECGLACVAMLTGRSTEEIKRVIFSEKDIQRKSVDNNGGFYTYCSDLLNALKQFNTGAEAISFKSWDDLNGIYIVGVKFEKAASNYFHWVLVIKDGGKSGRFIIIDPEDASVYYNGAAWVDTENGYFRRPNSSIVKVDMIVDIIDLSTITLAKDQ